MASAPASAIGRKTIVRKAYERDCTGQSRGFYAEEMTLSMGPQHPSTHGVLRFVVKADGEVMSEAIPDVGYLHRSIEKIGEKVAGMASCRTPIASTTLRRCSPTKVCMAAKSSPESRFRAGGSTVG